MIIRVILYLLHKFDAKINLIYGITFCKGTSKAAPKIDILQGRLVNKYCK